MKSSFKTIVVSAQTLKGQPYSYAYRIAGFEIVSQTEIALISPFEISINESSFEKISSKCISGEGLSDYLSGYIETYRGFGSFSGGEKHVFSSQKNDVQYLEINSQPFSLTNFQERTICLLGDNRSDNAVTAEVLLGPPLLCLLAHHGVFSFHAGAVKTPNGTAIFIGESGRGKSTLSIQNEQQGWYRLGDDIMPLSCLNESHANQTHNNAFTGEDSHEGMNSNNKGFYLTPKFPQLKRKQQYTGDDVLPLKAIFRIAQPNNLAEIDFRPISGQEALLTLSRHIASSRVFSSNLMTKKMTLIAALAKRIPVYDLSYPRDIDRLSELRTRIIERLSEC